MKNLINKIGLIISISAVEYQRDNLAFVTVDKANAVDMLTHLKNIEGFSHLVLISCVDWIEDGKFQLIYFLNNPVKKIDLGVRTMIARENAEMVSCHSLWKHVETYQRELREMYGIDFPGSPGVKENFILEGWDQIPPMRRDFDTMKYSEETFVFREGRVTNDPAKYMKEKLYPNSPLNAQATEDEK
jgi:NADH-quinone oxidoreductase subunit C